MSWPFHDASFSRMMSAASAAAGAAAAAAVKAQDAATAAAVALSRPASQNDVRLGRGRECLGRGDADNEAADIIEPYEPGSDSDATEDSESEGPEISDGDSNDGEPEFYCSRNVTVELTFEGGDGSTAFHVPHGATKDDIKRIVEDILDKYIENGLKLQIPPGEQLVAAKCETVIECTCEGGRLKGGCGQDGRDADCQGSDATSDAASDTSDLASTTEGSEAGAGETCNYQEEVQEQYEEFEVPEEWETEEAAAPQPVRIIEEPEEKVEARELVEKVALQPPPGALYYSRNTYVADGVDKSKVNTLLVQQSMALLNAASAADSACASFSAFFGSR